MQYAMQLDSVKCGLTQSGPSRVALRRKDAVEWRGAPAQERRSTVRAARVSVSDVE